MKNEDEAFDQIMESIGYYGKFQKRFSLLNIFIFNILFAMAYLSLILIAAVPDHWCHIPGRENTTFTLLEWKDLHLPKEENSWGKMDYSYCKMYNLTSVKEIFDKNSTEQIKCQYGYEYDDTWYKNTLPSIYDWVCDKDMYVSNVFMVSTIGEVVGSFMIGQLGDYIGRRPVYLMAIIVMISGKILGLFMAPIYYLFLFSSFVNSLPSVTATQSMLAISMEITNPAKRAHLAQIQSFGWCLGPVILSLVCWAIPEWTLYTVITTLPLTIYIFTYRYMIESPRWLASRGKIEECVKELQKIAKINGKDLQPDMIKKLRDTAKKPEAVYGIMSIVSSGRLAKNTLLLTFVFISYSVSNGIFILNTTHLVGNPFLQFLFQSIMELPAYAVGKYLCDHIGRRYTGVVGYFGSAVMFGIVIVMIKLKSGINLLNIFILSGKCCLSVVFYTQILQMMEIFPTCLRQTGMSLGIVMAGIFNGITPYIVYAGTAYDARYPYIIVGTVCCIAAVIQLFLPETLHVKLPETLQDAKDFGKDQNFFHAPWKQQKRKTKEEREETTFLPTT